MRRHEPAPTARRTRGMPTSTKTRVLVVDDEPHIARFVEFVLDTAGYDVVKTHDAVTAIELLRAQPFDAMVLDLFMPRHSGLDVLRALHAAPDAGPRVLVLTARSDAYNTELVSALGAAAHCAKPVAPTTLLRHLADLGVPPTVRSGSGGSHP